MDETFYETKWLRFLAPVRGRKTVLIEVVNKSDEHLGWIRWYGPWRQYTFVPLSSDERRVIFNDGCLQGIVDVLGWLRTDRLAMRGRGKEQ